MVVLGLHCCCVWAFSSCGVRGYSLVALHRLLIVVPSLVAEHRLCTQSSSVVAAHELSCSAPCGIFPDQGLNPRPLRWQVDSQSQDHQGRPWDLFKMRILTLYLRPTESETPGTEPQVCANSLRWPRCPVELGLGSSLPSTGWRSRGSFISPNRGVYEFKPQLGLFVFCLPIF